MQGLGEDERVVPLAFKMLGESIERVVDQGPRDQLGLDGRIDFEIVVRLACEPCFVLFRQLCAHKAESVFGLPAVFEDLALVFDLAVHLARVDPLGHRGADAVGEFRGHRLIRIEPERVFVRACLKSELFGADIPAPGGLDQHHLAPISPGPLLASKHQIHRVIGRARIHHDELSREPTDRLKHPPDRPGVVLARDHHRQSVRIGLRLIGSIGHTEIG